MGRKKRQQPEAATPTAAPSLSDAGCLPRFGAIMALAIILRLTALDWGIPGPRHGPYHPDEFNGIKGIYNLWNDPHHIKATYFVSTKGAGYFYTGLAVVALESKLGLLPPKSVQISRPEEMRRLYLSVRAVTVAFSMGTVVLVFFIGHRLFGPRTAELAAAIEAVNPISVINAHYIKTDAPEAFWVALALAFAVWSVRDRRWLAASVFTAGVAGAFKYPGISAVIFPLAAAALLRPEDRQARLKTAWLSLPLLAVGFVLFYPGAVADPKFFLEGLTSEAGRKMLTEWHIPLVRILGYPLAMAQGNGAALALWAWVAMVYALIHRRRENLLLMAWLLPYLLLMSSSVVVLVRYAVPMMPVMALLMAAMSERVVESRPDWARKTRVAVALALVSIIFVTGLHLRTMLRPDPRELAARWIAVSVPRGETVAVTPTHNGDIFFTVRVNRSLHRPLELYFRPEQDASNYLAKDFRWLAANEQAWQSLDSRHASQSRFWDEVNNPDRWSLAARFSNRIRWPGVLLRGRLPEDMYYLYLEIRIFRRAGLTTPARGDGDQRG